MKNPTFRYLLILWLTAMPMLWATPAVAQQGSYVQLTNSQYVKAYLPGMTVISSGSTSTITATTTLVQTMYCNNKTAAAATVTITDGSDNYYVGPVFSIPANSNLTLQWTNGLVLTGGIKASAGTASAIVCTFGGKQ